MAVIPDTAVLWALDANPPGAQFIQIAARTRTTLDNQLGTREVERILGDLEQHGWAAKLPGTRPARWIITPAGLDEAERRRHPT